MGLLSLISADLKANTGKTGKIHFLKSLLLEPAIWTLFLFRLASFMHARRFNKLCKLIWRMNVSSSACYLSPASTVGPGLALPHPVGVVIGEGCQIGSGVTLYQGVTLGRSISTGRYPVVGDGVTIYPNAVIAGGIEIGENAIIGISSVVLNNVPAGATMVGSPARQIR